MMNAAKAVGSLAFKGSFKRICYEVSTVFLEEQYFDWVLAQI